MFLLLKKRKQLNSDMDVVFSDAPIWERILPSARVGAFSVSTSATVVGLGKLALSGIKSLIGNTRVTVNSNKYGPASSYTNKILLQKQLASEAQMTETGHVISGKGVDENLRAASRLASQYGGNESDWAKMGSSSYSAWDGTQFETHWYKNFETGLSTEFKTKITAIVNVVIGK